MANYFVEEENELKNFLAQAKETEKLSDEKSLAAELYSENILRKERLEYNARMAQAKVIASQLYLTV